MKLSLVVRIHEDGRDVPKLAAGEHISSQAALMRWLSQEITLITTESEVGRSNLIGACACFLPDGRSRELDDAIAMVKNTAERQNWKAERFPLPDKNGHPALAGAYVWKPRKRSYAR